jgi:histone-binding protein RBBP4
MQFIFPVLFCRVSGGDYVEHQLILGTHTSGAEDNHLMIANVRLPAPDTVLDARKYDEDKGELGGYGGSGAKVEVSIVINHDKEVNRARYCPQNHFLIGMYLLDAMRLHSHARHLIDNTCL